MTQLPSVPKAVPRLLAKILLAALLVAGAWLIAQARAQSLSTSPPVLTLNVKPGQEVTRSVEIGSSAQTAFQLKIYLSDWAFNQDGSVYYRKPGTLAGSACPWITYSPSNYLLKAGATFRSRYTVQVPAGAKPGTHWCVLFFDGGSPNPPPGKTVATFRIRVGQTVYVNVEPVKQDGAITGMFTKPPKKSGDPYQLIVQYANTGDGVEWVTGTVDLRNAQGDTVRKLKLKGFTALPGGSRNLVIGVPGPLPAGTYAALAVLNYGKALTQVAGQTTLDLTSPLPAPSKAPAKPPAAAGGK